ncbi:phage tail tip fiber protein [Rhodomicrobium lacus]|uniref:phage tail tip fiber protein n=1 Tax=Rhodomicrobium lacus TaxID=2498452 RepID=UPI000F8CED24|nr:hypothetical protein [Rhodomicrobium lacus]
MAFIGVAIAGAIGLTGVAATVGAALVNGAVAVGLGMVARILFPTASASRGRNLSLSLETDEPRIVIFGTAATAGSLVYFNTWGSNSKYRLKNLDLVFALADHPCDGLEAIIINGEYVTWDPAATSGTISEWGNRISVWFYDGTQTAADAGLVSQAADGAWDAQCIGTGICYVRLQLSYDENTFQSGIPKFRFVVRGAALYDWRDAEQSASDPSTWKFTQNPVLAWYAYRTGVYVHGQRIGGMSTPASAIALDAATEAANACDEPVALRAGGTEPRYRIGAVIATKGSNHTSVLRDIAATWGGKEIDSGGEVRPCVGAARSPVLTITDDDLIASAPLEFAGKQPRTSLTNAVFGSFTSPADYYESKALPPRISTEDETLDGGVRFESSYDLVYVTSATQGQRILEIYRQLARNQATVKFTGRAHMMLLEAGDWIVWNSTRYGWTNKIWEVQSISVQPDATVAVALVETQAAAYAWEPSSQELSITAPVPLPSGGVTAYPVENLTVQAVTITVEGSSVSCPALAVTWTPPEDDQVDSILLQYRLVGGTEVLEYTCLAPESGAVTWVSGVQSGGTYEVRATLHAVPDRGTSWTPWVAATSAASSQVVAAAVTSEATTVAPGAVSEASLDAQTRFRLSLTTAANTVEGSVAAVSADITAQAQRNAEAAISAMLTSQEQVRSLRAERGALSAEVTEVMQAVAGQSAMWGIAVDVNGHVLGAVQLSGENASSEFVVVADRFQVALPAADGGDAVPVFTIADVDGTPKLVLRGDMLADGTITARALNVATLSAIVANLGVVTAGRLQSPDGLMYMDLSTKEFVISTNAS